MQIVLNGPEKHNALSNELVEELHGVFDKAESNDSLKLLILSAACPSFCRGHDLIQLGFQYGYKELPAGEKIRPPNQTARSNIDRRNICESEE